MAMKFYVVFLALGLTAVQSRCIQETEHLPSKRESLPDQNDAGEMTENLDVMKRLFNAQGSNNIETGYDLERRHLAEESDRGQNLNDDPVDQDAQEYDDERAVYDADEHYKATYDTDREKKDKDIDFEDQKANVNEQHKATQNVQKKRAGLWFDTYHN